MNKSLLGLLIALVLAVAALLFLRKQEKAPTESYPARELAVSHPDEVYRIFIADMQGRSMELVRRDRGYWYINDSLEAEATLMQNVLRAVSAIRIDHVPPQTVVPVVLKEMKATGLKVASFDAEGKPLKSIIIGPATQDERNSYVVVEGFDEPFAVRVPGFSGSLRPLFDLRSLDAWRAKAILRNDAEDINHVSVAYSRQPGESFQIERTTEDLVLSPISTVVVNPDGKLNPRRVESYLEGLETISATSRINNARTLDSLQGLVPFMQLKFTTGISDTTQLDFHPIYSLDLNNRPDPRLPVGKYHVVVNRRELVTIQTRIVEQLFRGYSSFYQ